MAGAHGTKAVVAALLANIGIAAAKFAGFVVTGSSSMLAESIHSVADSGNQCLLLLGGRRSRRDADAGHPFGFGRERYFWAFIVSMVLFSLGGAFAIVEGIEKLRHPHELESMEVALAILAFAMLLESLSFRTAVREARRIKDPEARWWSFVRRSKNPELPVVLLEDLGALIGLVIAFGAVTAAHVLDEPRYDAIGTLAIGVLLTLIAIVLAVEMKSLLIGESADRKVLESIRSAVDIEPATEQLVHLRTQHLGPEELLVGVKVAFLDGLSVTEVAQAVNRIEANIRRGVPEARIIYIEPGLLDVPLPDDPFAPGLPPTAHGTRPDDAALAEITGDDPDDDELDDDEPGPPPAHLRRRPLRAD